jgi:pimeloyl-ACP methyl ester carboxylesterase
MQSQNMRPADHGDLEAVMRYQRKLAAVILLCVLPATLMSMVGCSSPKPLPAAAAIPEFAALAAADVQLAPRTVRVPVDIDAAGRRKAELAIQETGTGQSDRVIVFVHGVLSDSRMWRFVRGGIDRKSDTLAADLLGCGTSDCPEPADVGDAPYAPEALARQLLSALRQRLAGRPQETHIALVGHSLGGMIIMRMYGDRALRDEFADVLARVDRLVLFSPVDAWANPQNSPFREIAKSSDTKFSLANGVGLLSERVHATIRTGVVDPDRAIREDADRMIGILSDRARRHAAQAMLRQAVPLRPDDTLDPQRATEIAAGYAHVASPCMILWGAQDEVLPVSMGYKLACEIPGASLRVISGARHCVPAEYPATGAMIINEFLAPSSQASPRIAQIDGLTGRMHHPIERGRDNADSTRIVFLLSPELLLLATPLSTALPIPPLPPDVRIFP